MCKDLNFSNIRKILAEGSTGQIWPGLQQ